MSGSQQHRGFLIFLYFVQRAVFSKYSFTTNEKDNVLIHVICRVISFIISMYFTKIFICLSLCLCEYTLCKCRYLEDQKSVWSPGSDTGAHEPPHVGTGNQTCVLRKSHKRSYVLSHLSSSNKKAFRVNFLYVELFQNMDPPFEYIC